MPISVPHSSAAPPGNYLAHQAHSPATSTCSMKTTVDATRNQGPHRRKILSAKSQHLAASTAACPCKQGLFDSRSVNYQTRQLLTGIIGWPTLQPNALPNSSKFCTVPFTLHSPVLCGSVFACTRALCSV
jgi:hypothetical protein